MLFKLAPGKVYLDYGPMQITIAAFRQEQPLQQEVEEAAEYAQEILSQIASFLPVAKLPFPEIKQVVNLPPVLRSMVEAVHRCNEPTLTPMAAVAGSVADSVADYLVVRGASKVIVNNGGDIALRLAKGESTKVGIASDINLSTFTHILEVDHQSGIGGITTSGLGGRSFTKGIASAVVSLGVNSGFADACATLIGNHTYSPDPGIRQLPAEAIDPETDIRGHLVTVGIDTLSPDTPSKALFNGISKAKELVSQQLIQGAIIFVGAQMCAVPESLEKKIRPVGLTPKNKII